MLPNSQRPITGNLSPVPDSEQGYLCNSVPAETLRPYQGPHGPSTGQDRPAASDGAEPPSHGRIGSPSPSSPQEASPNRDTELFREALKGRDARNLSIKQLSQALRDAQKLKEKAHAGCEATGVDLKPVPDTDLMMCVECRDQVLRAHMEGK